MQPRHFPESELRELLEMADAIEAMRSAFRQLSDGRARVPVRTAVEGAGTTGLFMPGWLPDDGALGTKIVTVRPGNAGGPDPVVQALLVALDPETGRVRATMDGTWLTALRTGAATGLATELLARPGARTLAVVGAGGQARAQIEAVRAVRPIEVVRIRSRSGVRAERLARELAREAGDDRSVTFEAVPDRAEHLREAEVIVTATDALDPVLPDELPSGVHVNAVGAYLPTMCEVPPAVIGRARVFVDERAAARAEAGDLHRAVQAGRFAWDDVAGELGEVVLGRVEGRRHPDDVTVFKSVGSAAQDLAVMAAVLRAAEAPGRPGGA